MPDFRSPVLDPQPPMVAVVIPNWNGRRFLGPCFDSLRGQQFRDFEVILVDNGSHDDSVAFTTASYPEIRVTALPENQGFAAAANRGIQAARGRYVGLLNNVYVIEQLFYLAAASDDAKEPLEIALRNLFRDSNRLREEGKRDKLFSETGDSWLDECNGRNWHKLVRES